MTNRMLLLIMCCIFVVQMSGCQNRRYMKEPEFEWNTYWDADENYPMELVFGSMDCSGGKGGHPMRPGYSKGPWGADNHTAGGHSKMLPNKLHLKWYSFVEDKSYQGSFDLPYDMLVEMFQRTYLRHRLKDYWYNDRFIVGLAPGGQVYLWVGGLGKNQVFVAKFQAEETHIDQRILTGTFHSEYERWPEERWPEIMDRYRRETFCGKIEDNYNTKGLQLGLWDRYNERFKWKPEIIYEDSTAGWKTDEVLMQFYNGEQEVLALGSLEQNSIKERPRIRFFNCYYTNWKEYRNVEITINEDELFEAFSEVFDNDPECEANIEIRLNEANNFFRVFIISLDPEHKKRVELKKAVIKRYYTYRPSLIECYHRK